MVVPAHIDRAALDPVELLQDLVLTSSQLSRDIGESVGKFGIIMLSSQLGSPIAGQPVMRPRLSICPSLRAGERSFSRKAPMALSRVAASIPALVPSLVWSMCSRQAPRAQNSPRESHRR